MPTPQDIKTNNTQLLTMFIQSVAKENNLKSATIAGAGLSVFADAILQQAADEGIDIVRRTLDRAIELLTAMREAPHADAMMDTALEIVKRQNADVSKRDRT